MKNYTFRILNVFAETTFGGNPLAVFEDGRGLDDATMQAIALQFNLSETTFILPSTAATARVRIFTPSFEMPFAGHPTLGTAHVVRALFGGDAVTLEMKAGIIPVASRGDRWTLTAKAPGARPVEADAATLAEMLGIAANEIAEGPMWVDTGSEQLIVPLANADAVRRCNPSSALLPRWPRSRDGRAMALAWAGSDGENILARFFFTKGSMIAEDPGTGSACANLGGWFITRGQQGPLSRRIRQGEAVGRPCVLGLDIDAAQRIQVSGRVIELGRGEIRLPDAP
jgi:PhzF family phenazine biosynthesis protein